MPCDQLVEHAWLLSVCQVESAVHNASLFSGTDASGSQSQCDVQAVLVNKGQWKRHKPRTEQFKRCKDSKALKPNQHCYRCG